MSKHLRCRIKLKEHLPIIFWIGSQPILKNWLLEEITTYEKLGTSQGSMFRILQKMYIFEINCGDDLDLYCNRKLLKIKPRKWKIKWCNIVLNLLGVSEFLHQLHAMEEWSRLFNSLWKKNNLMKIVRLILYFRGCYNFVYSMFSSNLSNYIFLTGTLHGNLV